MEKERKKIIIVDDNKTNLTAARNTLIGTYDAFTVPSGEKLFSLLERLTPDLILLDVEMPEMNGYEVIKKLKASKRTAAIPVIFLSAKIDPESEIEGLRLGAVDYVFKPFSRELLLKRIELHLLLESQRNKLRRYSGNLVDMVFEKTKTVFELQNAVLRTVAELVESRDHVTGGHIMRTQRYLRLLVELLIKNGVYADDLLSWDIDLFIMSSQLHDVGKISIKDNILLKPDSLSLEESEEMKLHTIFGMQIIERLEQKTNESDFLLHAKALAGSHHERWDGSGYPLGAKGAEIPLQGRIMAIVDVYDALTNDRPYKKRIVHDEAVSMIRDGLGTHFDPQICEVFLRHEDDFANAYITGVGYDVAALPPAQLNTFFSAVSDIVDIRGGTKNGHTERMRRYLRTFLEILLDDEKFREEVSDWDPRLFLMSAQLHDIGKIAVSDAILGKSGRLTDDELEGVKYHADFGIRVIEEISENVDNADLLSHAKAMTGGHHEKWDGSGYPLGKKGEDIPLQGRLMAIVDVYDALTNQRPHRDRMNHREAVDIIANLSGTQFDPDLVELFLKHESEFEMIGTELSA